MNALRPGGFLFVGDVRSLPLLEAFHVSLQLAKATDSLSLEQFRERVRQNVDREKELVIDPAFFTAFGQRAARAGRTKVLLKRGRRHNELTRFRYDAILQVGSGSVASRGRARSRLEDRSPHHLGRAPAAGN